MTDLSRAAGTIGPVMAAPSISNASARSPRSTRGMSVSWASSHGSTFRTCRTSQPLRSRRTGSFTSPRATASCMRSMRPAENCSGPTTPRSLGSKMRHRVGQPRFGAVARQGLRRYSGRAPRRPRCAPWTACLGGRYHAAGRYPLHHRGAARLSRQSIDRPGRRGLRRNARLRDCVRRRERQTTVAFLLGTRRSRQGIRERGHAHGRHDLDRASGGDSAAAARCGTR